MEEFNTQVATNIEQSQKLISLGIKKETADVEIDCLTGKIRHLDNEPYEDCGETIAAWSLHRLIKLAFPKGVALLPINNPFEMCINRIEKYIKNKIFNKEYLNEV